MSGANDWRIGDHVRRKNGVKIGIVKYIRNGRLYFHRPGKTWFDWESVDHAVLVRRAGIAEDDATESKLASNEETEDA